MQLEISWQIWEYDFLNELVEWRMVSSGMFRRVDLVRTDVAEELSAYIFRVTRIGEVGT
jgi:hypothetical protein